VDTPQVRIMLAEENSLLVSVRSWEEYIGATSGYPWLAPRGRIAGAVWAASGTGADDIQYYRSPDGTMRSYPEIEASWRQAGITPDRRVAFYCGTGWRAAEAFLYVHLMGWPHVSVYDGGWLEWCQDAANPVEIGAPAASGLGSPLPEEGAVTAGVGGRGH
jgi:thiosulfate/3-mercaptopyruvate sulfurtransferase